MRKSVVALSLLSLALTPVAAFASVTRCYVEKPREIDPRWFWFDTKTRQATIEWMGDVTQGRVTLIRDHAPFGEKVNLVFPSSLDPNDPTARLEIIVAPTSKSTHRMIGVVTKVIAGERHLHAGAANTDVVCTKTNP